MNGRRPKERIGRRVQNCNSNHGIKPKCNGLTSFAISFGNTAAAGRRSFWLSPFFVVLAFYAFFAPHILATNTTPEYRFHFLNDELLHFV